MGAPARATEWPIAAVEPRKIRSRASRDRGVKSVRPSPPRPPSSNACTESAKSAQIHQQAARRSKNTVASGERSHQQTSASTNSTAPSLPTPNPKLPCSDTRRRRLFLPATSKRRGNHTVTSHPKEYEIHGSESERQERGRNRLRAEALHKHLARRNRERTKEGGADLRGCIHGVPAHGSSRPKPTRR